MLLFMSGDDEWDATKKGVSRLKIEIVGLSEGPKFRFRSVGVSTFRAKDYERWWVSHRAP